MVMSSKAVRDTIDQGSLPFSVDKKSFSVWFIKLERVKRTEKLRFLLDILQKLKPMVIPADIRFYFLEKISIFISQQSKELRSQRAKTYLPFSKEENIIINLLVCSATELAENYSVICSDKSFNSAVVFTPSEKLSILTYAIQVMFHVLLFEAILYKPTSKGFWALCYSFYFFAKQDDILDEIANKKNTSFIKTFKSILLLQLSHTQQFNTEEICTISTLLSNLSEHVTLLPTVPEKKMNSLPCLDLRTDVAPAISKDGIVEESSYLFYISVLNVVKQLFDLLANNTNISYADRVMVLRLVKTLTMNRQRKDERILADNEISAEVGFEKFTEYLLHKDSLSKTKGTISYEEQYLELVDDFDESKSKGITDFQSERGVVLAIAKTSNEKENSKRVSRTDIWNNKKRKNDLKDAEVGGRNATLINESQLGFCVRLKKEGMATRVGDIIHLLIAPTSVVTVVRRIVSVHSGSVVVGVEVLGYDAELLHVMDIEKQEVMAAGILTSLHGNLSVVIKAGDFDNEEFLYVDCDEKVNRYRVEKILGTSTAEIKHLKVSLS